MNRPQRFEIRHYLTPDSTDLYEEWLETLDRAVSDRIDAYVTRMASANFGMTRSVGDGIQELKLNFGPGYRIYYLRDSEQIIVLLCGGNKADQFGDILKAKRLGTEYWRRK